jgi:LmbE family N-acetylglucosaminyl deacetylase
MAEFSHKELKYLVMKKKCLILSPHYDDAALSCADYISYLQKQNYQVYVCNVFTTFQSLNNPPHTLRYLKNSGTTSVAKFQKMRSDEDKTATKIMKVKTFNLGFVDGGFRVINSSPIYPSSKKLFSGLPHQQDQPILSTLVKLFSFLEPKFDLWICPLGIGGHADHILVKKAAQKVIQKQRIQFYVDMPYGLQPKNWLSLQTTKLISMKKKLIPQSGNKRTTIKAYKSQVPVLFSDGIPNYREMILS